MKPRTDLLSYLITSLSSPYSSPPVSLQMSVAAGVDALGGELHLDSWVTAHLVDGSSHRGVLHTVDPETGTVILLKPEGVSACEPNRDACMQLC